MAEPSEAPLLNNPSLETVATVFWPQTLVILYDMVAAPSLVVLTDISVLGVIKMLASGLGGDFKAKSAKT